MSGGLSNDTGPAIQAFATLMLAPQLYIQEQGQRRPAEAVTLRPDRSKGAPALLVTVFDARRDCYVAHTMECFRHHPAVRDWARYIPRRCALGTPAHRWCTSDCARLAGATLMPGVPELSDRHPLTEDTAQVPALRVLAARVLARACNDPAQMDATSRAHLTRHLWGIGPTLPQEDAAAAIQHKHKKRPWASLAEVAAAGIVLDLVPAKRPRRAVEEEEDSLFEEDTPGVPRRNAYGEPETEPRRGPRRQCRVMCLHK